MHGPITVIPCIAGIATTCDTTIIIITATSDPPLIHEDPCEEQHHGKHDVDGEAELLREEEAAQNSSEHVSCGRAVLLHNIVKFLKDGGNHQPPHTAKEESHHQQHLHPGCHIC